MADTPNIRFKGFTEPWEQRKLGEMMNITSVKRIHQSDWTDSGVRFLRARDIVAASKNEEPDDYLYISEEKYEEYSALSGKVDIDDLLVTGVGTIGVPYLVENLEPLYFKDGNIIWFQSKNKIDGKFLYYSFIGNGIQSFIKASAGTGTVGTYTIDTGKKTPIQFPSKEEQKKIGEYLTNLDHLITLHQRKYFLSYNNLRTWEQRKLGEICDSFEYGLNAAATDYDGENKYIRITDIDDNSHEFLQNNVTSPDIDFSGAENYKLKQGDILFARTGASVGKTYIYEESDGLVYYAGFLIRGRVKYEYSPEFVFQNTLTADYERFIRITSQRSGQPGVNAQEYASYQIATPVLEEQQQIGAYFSNLDHLITLHRRTFYF